MDITKNLKLPYMYINQSQKELVYNQAITTIDQTLSTVQRTTIPCFSNNIIFQNILQSGEIDLSQTAFYNAEQEMIIFDLPVSLHIEFISNSQDNPHLVENTIIIITGKDYTGATRSMEYNYYHPEQTEIFFQEITSITSNNAEIFLSITVLKNLLIIRNGNYIAELRTNSVLQLENTEGLYADIIIINNTHELLFAHSNIIYNQTPENDWSIRNYKFYRSYNSESIYSIIN